MTRSISIVTGWPAPNVNMVCLTHVQEPPGFRRNDLHRSEVMTFRAEELCADSGWQCTRPMRHPVSARVRRRAASSPSLSRLVLHLGLACGYAYRVGKLVALALGTVWWFTTFGTPLRSSGLFIGSPSFGGGARLRCSPHVLQCRSALILVLAPCGNALRAGGRPCRRIARREAVVYSVVDSFLLGLFRLGFS